MPQRNIKIHTAMENFYQTIENEVQKSSEKFMTLPSSTFGGYQQRLSVFTQELGRLNQIIQELFSVYVSENEFNETQISEIKKCINAIIMEFILNSGIAGVSPDFTMELE